MLRQKPLVVSLLLAGLIASTNVNALGLTRLNVTTALGQPLVAEVDVLLNAGEDADSIRANIAAPSIYKASNVEYQGVLQTIRVQTLKRPTGQPYLRLTSSQAINEPYLDILLEVNSSTGRLVRQYMFLLDPPEMSTAQNIEPKQPVRPMTGSSPAPAPMPAPSVAAPAPAPVAQQSRPAPAPAPSADSYTVRRGDTLFAIASRNAQAGVSLEQYMLAIQRANPGAFAGNNINRLRSGVTLQLPGASEAQSISATAANREVRAQTASWRSYVSRVAGELPSSDSNQSTQTTSGQVAGLSVDTAGSGPRGDKLTLSSGDKSTADARKEDKVASGKQIAENDARIQELENTIRIQQEALAKLQSQAKSATASSEPPPAPAPVVDAPAPAPAAPVASVAPAPSAPEAAAPAPASVEPPPAPVAATPAVEPPAAPVAPPPPVEAKPKVTAPPPPPSEPGFFDFLSDLPLPMIGGAAALIVLLGGLLLARSRSRKKAEGPLTITRLSEPVPGGSGPDTVFGVSGIGASRTNEAPVHSQFSRSGMGTIDSAEVDPVAEAEVYIAYGREAQAEEILREALSRDPKRPDVIVKLAEISAVQGKREAFDQLADDLKAANASNDYQQKLASLALAHFPGHPLAGDAPVTTSRSTLSGQTPAGGVSAALGAVAAEAVSTDDAPSANAEPLHTQPSEPVTLDSLDFVLDSATISPPVKGQSFDIGEDDLKFDMPAPAAASDEAAPAPSAKPVNKSLEADLAELEASLKKATDSGAVPDAAMDFTDFSTARPTNLGTVGPALRPEMLDLNFDAGRPGFADPTPSILDGQWHDAATKLDLARAYEEMGDREGAREILREVLHDGDDAQKEEAKALLAKLGG